jgi:hypothetical protein
MLADVYQVSPHTIIQRTRLLPLMGRVLVSLGDAVQAQDVVAEAILPAKTISLDVCRGLGLSEDEIRDCVLSKPGDVLKKGDLIAQREGAVSRVLRAPEDGTLIEVSRGKALLSTDAIIIQVRAGVIGIVTDVFPEMGVSLRAEGGLVQGVWGNGRCGGGPLSMPSVISEGDAAEIEQIRESLLPGNLLAIEHCTDVDLLQKIIDVGMAGLICGTLAPELVRLAVSWDKPMLVLQGFEPQPVDPVSWEFFVSRIGTTAGINALPTELWQGDRPEVLFPFEGGEPEKPLPFRVELKVGQRVRILAGPAVGRTGKIVVLGEETEFESGLRYPMTTVQLREGDRLTVPQQNLAVLG